MYRLSPEGKVKRRALVHSGLGPDAPTMTMDDALHNRQTHPCPFVIFGAVQALKHAEEFVRIGHVEAHPVVPDKIDLLSLLLATADRDYGYLALAGKFERVGH